MPYRTHLLVIACLLGVFLSGCGISEPERVDPRIKYQATLSRLPEDADRSTNQLAVQARLVRRGLYRDTHGRLQTLRASSKRTAEQPAPSTIPDVRQGGLPPVEQPAVMLPLPE